MTLTLRPSPARPGPTMVLLYARVESNEQVVSEHFRLRLDAPSIAAAALPGQFAMLSVVRTSEGTPVLPRPMALFDWDPVSGWIDFVYRVIGRGTARMATFRRGETMVVVGPLGRPFSRDMSADHLLVLGRGIGICSLTALAAEARTRGVEVEAVVSARRVELLVALDFFERRSCRVRAVNDVDGTSDVERLRASLFSAFDVRPPKQIAVCGSDRLLQLAGELGARYGATVEVSLEARMACGLGYCHGCASGHAGLDQESPLLCVDGPVFRCE